MQAEGPGLHCFLLTQFEKGYSIMLTHKGTKDLRTPRLLLRRFTAADTETVFKNWTSDEEVTRYLTWQPHAAESITQALLEHWTANYIRDDFYQWAIEFEGGPIGTISVVDHNDSIEMAEIGYCIGKAWWHRGIMSEALGAVIDYLFDEVGMQRIEARHDPRNPHSGGVMQKCGMKYEGTHRRADRNNQGVCDAAYYAILADER